MKPEFVSFNVSVWRDGQHIVWNIQRTNKRRGLLAEKDRWTGRTVVGGRARQVMHDRIYDRVTKILSTVHETVDDRQAESHGEKGAGDD